jgi:hypothetical protein
MSHQEACQACAARPGVCPVCEGTGEVMVPSVTDKIAYHLMHAPDNGLGLMPAEVAELGQALGLTPAPEPYPPADTCYCGNGHPHVHLDAPDDKPGAV